MTNMNQELILMLMLMLVIVIVIEPIEPSTITSRSAKEEIAQRGGQIMRQSQPARKQSPPKGVIAPSHFTFVRESR